MRHTIEGPYSLYSPAAEADVHCVMDDLRPGDRDEWVAFCGGKTRERMLASIKGTVSYSVGMEGHPNSLLVGGVDDLGDGQASVWLAATNLAEKHAYSLHALLKPELRRLGERFHTLVALSDKRNRLHHEWMVWLGFDLLDERPFGPFGLPFYLFERRS